MSVDEQTRNRFREMFPDAIPWRDRARTDSLASSLIHSDATDAEAADMYAAAYARLFREHTRMVELTTNPMRVVYGNSLERERCACKIPTSPNYAGECGRCLRPIA